MSITGRKLDRPTCWQSMLCRAVLPSPHRKRAISRWLLASISGILLAVPVTSADQPVGFFDHFTDGNIQDDAPISWSNGGLGETLSVVDGDLLLTPEPELAAAIVDEAGYEDVSLLTRLRVSNPSFTNVGLIARQDGALAYTAGISGNRYGVYDHSLVLTYGGLLKPNLKVLASVPTHLDPSTTDVLLQFDLVGDALSLFAWADGTPRPAQPQLAIRDGRIRQGAIGTFFDSDSSSATAVFRELLAMPGQSGAADLVRLPHQAEVSIPETGQAAVPEPSSIASALLALALATISRLRRRPKDCWIMV